MQCNRDFAIIIIGIQYKMRRLLQYVILVVLCVLPFAKGLQCIYCTTAYSYNFNRII